MAQPLWSNVGGYMWSANLSKVLRNAVQPTCKFRQFADIKDAAVQGKGKGDTFHWNVYSDIAVQGTKLQESQTMPESNFTVTQGTMTITEYGNSVPYSGKLDDLSLHPVKEVINKVLKNDAKKAFDFAAADQFDLTPLRVTPVAGTDASLVTVTTAGSVGVATNTKAMQADHVKAIIDEMKERNIPPYEGDDYFCLGRPRTFRAFKNDLEALHKYVQEGFTQIANGEMGRFEGTRFVEQTNVPASIATGVRQAWSQGKSGPAYFFGQDTVAEGIAIPEEMRGKIPTDFGRSRGIAWYYLGGFGLVHTQATQARIMKWDSAI